MNKADLIEAVAARIDSSKKDAAQAVEAVVDAITEAVAKGQKVSISGFGVFEKAARPARTYRRPSTGEAIRKMATSVPRFRPGGDFKAFVAGEKQFVEGAVRAAREAGEAAAAVAESVVETVVETAMVRVGLQHRTEPTPTASQPGAAEPEVPAEPAAEAPSGAAEQASPVVPTQGSAVGEAGEALAAESAATSAPPPPRADDVAGGSRSSGAASKTVTARLGGTLHTHKPMVDDPEERTRRHLSRPLREAKAAGDKAAAAAAELAD